MSFHYRYRKQLLWSVIFLLIIGLIASGIYLNFKQTNQKVKQDKMPVLASITKVEDEPEKEIYQVDIKGQVINPGLYQLESGSRVMDAITAAGGLSEIADISVLNLSKKIFDEMVIIVYSKEEVMDFTKVKEEEQLKLEKCKQKDEEQVKNDACIDLEETETNEQSKISLNQATLEDLMTLPGIGEAKAKDILDYREEHETFTSIDELKDIKGIGETLFAKIKDYVTL